MYLFVIVFLIKIIKKNNLLKHCKDKNKKLKLIFLKEIPEYFL